MKLESLWTNLGEFELMLSDYAQDSFKSIQCYSNVAQVQSFLFKMHSIFIQSRSNSFKRHSNSLDVRFVLGKRYETTKLKFISHLY